MRKTHCFGLLLVIVLALLVSFTGSVSAQTQAVVCPTGFICTPINQAKVANSVNTTPCYKFSSEMGYKGIYGSVSTGSEVAYLQKLLISKGFDIPSITKANTPAGSFDEDTKKAVMEYQASKGIRSTGYVGPLTNVSLCLPDDPATITRLVNVSVDNNDVLVNWVGYTGDFDSYQIVIGNTFLNKEVVVLASVDKKRTAASSEIPWKFLSEVNGNSNSKSANYIKVNAIKSSWVGGGVVNTIKSSEFVINTSSPSPSPSNSSNVSSVTVSAYLAGASENKVGAWNAFSPNTGNMNQNGSDWKWVMKLSVPNGVVKNIKRITIKHNVSGEVWSTGYSRYLQDGTDLYGYNEHPYPLVVTQFGTQSNKEYDQSLNEKPYTSGNHEFVLYGQPESDSFRGGKLIVEFTDKTSTVAEIPASSIKQGSSASSDNFICPAGYVCSTPSPSASPSNTVTPMIYSITPTKGGLNTPIVLEGANFSAVTSLDLYASSGKWMGTLVPSQVSSNRITFSFSKAFTANTGSDTYQLSAVSSNCKAGCNSNRVSYTLDNSASTPTPTISPVQTPNQPRVSFTYPVGSETWMVGDTKTVSWSYANFDSNVSGDKWVDLMLQPMDGREPVKLATYTAPYTSTPLKIYTKTTDGRNAWLPGQYKLKLVCRSTNIEGFRSCAEAMPGYITIVQPSPTPTPTSEATIMQNTTGADLNASIWSAVEEYLRNR